MVDIFNPEVSQVTKGIEGKLILIYGTNSTGKTKTLPRLTNRWCVVLRTASVLSMASRTLRSKSGLIGRVSLNS